MTSIRTSKDLADYISQLPGFEFDLGDVDIDEQGTILYATIPLIISDKIGDNTHEKSMDIIYHCGWIMRGASADLDGSGLSLWGNSQPGGWSVCDSDGYRMGGLHVRIAMTNSVPDDDSDDSILSGEFGWESADSSIMFPIPECRVFADGEVTEEQVSDALFEYADSFCNKIISAIHVDEPDSECFWDWMDENDEVVKGICRVSNWNGYTVVAFRVSDEEYSHYVMGIQNKSDVISKIQDILENTEWATDAMLSGFDENE